MFELIILFAGGALGQGLRGLLGLIKARRDKQPIDWVYFSLSLLGGALAGGALGIVTGGNFTTAFMAGFASVDALESLSGMRK